MITCQPNARARQAKRKTNRSNIVIFGAVAGLVGMSTAAYAANEYSWSGAAGSTWAGANWVPSAGGSAVVWANGTSDTADFSGTEPHTTISASTEKAGFIWFENSPPNYLIYLGTFTLASGGNVTLQSTAGANTIETINSTLNIAGSYSFTNNDSDPGSALNFGGTIGISSSGTSYTLTLNGTGPGTNTLSGVVGNGNGAKLSLVIGGSVWKLSGNANTYTGNTTVNTGGTLIVANTAGSATNTGTVTVGGTTAIPGILASGTTGLISGTVTGNGGGVIAPGGIGNDGTLTLGGAFTTTGGTSPTTLNFDLGTGPIVSGGISGGDLLTLNGATTIAPGTALSFGGTPVAGDDYPLIGGTSASGIATGNFVLPTAPTGETYSLSTTVQSGFVDLVVGTSSGPASLTWNNAGGGDGIHWDTTSKNWNNGTGSATYSDTSNTTTGDNVTFNDTNNSNYAVTINGSVHPTSTIFNTNNASGYVITGANSSSGISGTGSLTLSGTGLVTISSNNNYSGGTFVTAGTLKLASGTAFPANTALNVSSGAQVILANHASSATFVPQISVLNNSGSIDITNNALVVHNGSIGTITTEVTQAYNSGTWTGTNASSGVIGSSTAAGDTSHLTAVGVASGLTSFEGLTVLPSDVLVKLTYYGDADLSGVVDGSDYSRIDNAYLNNQNTSNTALTGWFNGDFNYDGVINGSDYTLMDNAFNSQGAAIASEVASAVPTAQIAGGTSAVPEPTTLGLLGIGALSLLSRRRHRLDAMKW